MRLHFFSLLFFFIISSVCYGQISIQQARGGALGTSVTVKGIVTNGNELGIIKYIEDGTAGIGLYDAVLTTSLNRGDTVIATGILYNFNNLLELSPLSSVNVINSGNPLPIPQLITPAQMDETKEGELVKINNCQFANAGANFSGNTTYLVTSSSTNFLIYVRTGSPLIGQLIPFGPINITGIASQYASDYQLLPRDINDLEPTIQIQIISPITVDNILPGGFNLNWETDSLGSSIVQYGVTPLLELGSVVGNPNTTNHVVQLSGLIPASFYYARVLSTDGSDTAYSSIKLYSTQSLSSGDIKVYFNTTVDTIASNGFFATQLPNAIDDTLIAYMNRADESLDITIYDFNNTNISSISAAINDAYNRGVKVRFISDGSLLVSNSGVSDLLPAIPRIQSPTSASYGIMHNKFVIIDALSSDPLKPIVWTGATNWQEGQINEDPNNVIIFQDQALAKAYRLEFEEMWGDTDLTPNQAFARFGPFKIDNTPHEFNIGGKRTECYFSPSDQTNDYLLNTINSANSNLYFSSMVITRPDLASAIVAQSQAGIETFGITNSSVNSTQWGTLSTGLPAGHMIENPDTTIIMHHKYLVVDHNNLNSDPLVWTGSHNWSNNANNKNDENSVVVHDANIANQFFQEFHSRFIAYGGLILNLAQNDEKSLIYLYPNPATEQINVSGILTKGYQYTILDYTGKQVKLGQLNGTSQTIDCSGLAKGFYLFSIQYKTEKPEQIKFILH
jgi:phosphatidylserine/phosphatidylglycerophosphate/cardiolipin synthase-like enzyme